MNTPTAQPQKCKHYHAECMCVGDLVYRGACLHCSWEGTTRPSENQAAEDAHDHAWPGWRALPIAPRPPETAATARNQARTRWVKTITVLYPPGWLEAGGPIRTTRHRSGTRHIPNHTGFGGYDLCGHVLTPEDHHRAVRVDSNVKPLPDVRAVLAKRSPQQWLARTKKCGSHPFLIPSILNRGPYRARTLDSRRLASSTRKNRAPAAATAHPSHPRHVGSLIATDHMSRHTPQHICFEDHAHADGVIAFVQPHDAGRQFMAWRCQCECVTRGSNHAAHPVATDPKHSVAVIADPAHPYRAVIDRRAHDDASAEPFDLICVFLNVDAQR